jgi:hypothetical protein
MTNEPNVNDVSVSEVSGAGPRISSIQLPRRTVLRAAGVAVALPILEAMGPESAAPRRLVYVYVPNGVKVDEWREEIPVLPQSRVEARKHRRHGPLLAVGDHRGDELPALLKPLESIRERMLLIRGLTADKSRANGDGPGDHARAAAAFLTGVQPLKTEGRVRLGVSADQVAGRAVGGATRVRALSLGLERGLQSGQCDSGYACAYSGHISWESSEVPAAKEVRPQAVFDRLFRGGDAGLSAEARKERRLRRRSVLDFVRGDAKALRRRLGAADRNRVDEYETGLRELERQLEFENSAHVESVPDSARPKEEERTFEEEARLMGEILSLALEADITRVGTLMYGNEGSGRRYHEIGVTDGHHSLSHHAGDEHKLEAIGKINRLHLASFAALVQSLASKGRPGGSLLDETMLVYGSGIAEGNRHDHHDLPVLLVGGESTDIRGGRTLVVPRETPLNNLHAALLKRMGVTDGHLLGDATGVLDGLA